MDAAISPGVVPRVTVSALPSGKVTVTLDAEAGADTAFLLKNRLGAEHREGAAGSQAKVGRGLFAATAKRANMAAQTRLYRSR